MYDIIVVGARCAGSPTAMLLARRGCKVLLVDRVTFPRDTVSTHIVWPHGAELLAHWGLLPRLEATGVPRICRDITFDVGPFALHGTIPDANNGTGGFCPRRTVLDALLADAARDAGAEVRSGCQVDELLFDGDRVAGVAGRGRDGTRWRERATLVVGADGVHSFVAGAVAAPEYDTRPPVGCAYYSYFSGVEQHDIELYVRTGHAFGGAPTNGGLTLVMVNWPAERFADVRKDIEGNVWAALASAPDFAARVRTARREEKWYGSGGVPNYFRRPFGKGWVLVGDAAYCTDPITAQGISDAFLDAASLAAAIDRHLSGGRTDDADFRAHEAARNDRVRPMHEFTLHLAALEPPPPAMQALFGALRGNADATNAFFSAITGAIPLQDFMAEENIGRILAAAGAAAPVLPAD